MDLTYDAKCNSNTCGCDRACDSDNPCSCDYTCDFDICACDTTCWKDNPIGCGCDETSYNVHGEK